MKYIHTPEDDSIMFSRYNDYIMTIKDKIPSEFRDIATESRFYDLSSKESLHDAHVRKIEIHETDGNQATDEASSVTISIEFRGAYRKIFLEYSRVIDYRMKGPDDAIFFDTYHGDLYTHEFRIEKENEFIHELSFVTGALIEITFESLKHWGEEYHRPLTEGNSE